MLTERGASGVRSHPHPPLPLLSVSPLAHRTATCNNIIIHLLLSNSKKTVISIEVSGGDDFCKLDYSSHFTLFDLLFDVYTAAVLLWCCWLSPLIYAKGGSFSGITVLYGGEA